MPFHCFVWGADKICPPAHHNFQKLFGKQWRGSRRVPYWVGQPKSIKLLTGSHPESVEVEICLHNFQCLHHFYCDDKRWSGVKTDIFYRMPHIRRDSPPISPHRHANHFSLWRKISEILSSQIGIFHHYENSLVWNISQRIVIWRQKWSISPRPTTDCPPVCISFLRYVIRNSIGPARTALSQHFWVSPLISTIGGDNKRKSGTPNISRTCIFGENRYVHPSRNRLFRYNPPLVFPLWRKKFFWSDFPISAKIGQFSDCGDNLNAHVVERELYLISKK